MRKEAKCCAFGETKTRREWALDGRCKVNLAALSARLIRGWGPEAALVVPADGTKRRYPGWDEQKNIVGWLTDTRCSVSATVLLARLEVGEPLESALGRPEPGHPPELFRLKAATHESSAAADRKYVAFGEAKSLKAWARDKRCNCNYLSLKSKTGKGMDLEAAMLFTADEAYRGYWAFGEVRKFGSWLRDSRCKLPGSVLKARMDSGERFESAVTRPATEPLLEQPNRYGTAGRQRADLVEAMEQLQDEWGIVKLTLFGETKTASQWRFDARCEISYEVIMNRVRAGWPEDERILQRTGKASPLDDPFSAVTEDGLDLGDFQTIRAAEAAIEAKGGRGTIRDRLMGREIEVPRVKLRRNPSRKCLQLTAWGETKNGAEWARDPRCAVDLETIYSRLHSKKKVWDPEAVISTPPREKFVGDARILVAKFYDAFGETKTLSEWSADSRCRVRPSALKGIIQKGFPMEQALGGLRKQYEAFGEQKTLTEWARDERCEVSLTLIKLRLQRGLPMETAMKRVRPGGKRSKDKLLPA